MIPRHLVIAMAILVIAALSLGLYALHVRKTVRATVLAPTDTRPLAPPVAGPTENVTLFVAHDEDGSLRPEAAQIPMSSGRQQRAEELLRALVSLYLNSAFADTHRSGVLVEELTVASLIHTVSANTPGIVKVKVLVDGQDRDTLAGHADLSDYYDIIAVNQLATQLAGQ
jgi:Sporulation and spore germination